MSSARHADGLAAGALPRHHDDPFDRMLIAQAVRRDLTVITADRRFAQYDVRLLPRARTARETEWRRTVSSRR